MELIKKMISILEKKMERIFIWAEKLWKKLFKTVKHSVHWSMSHRDVSTQRNRRRCNSWYCIREKHSRRERNSFRHNLRRRYRFKLLQRSYSINLVRIIRIPIKCHLMTHYQLLEISLILHQLLKIEKYKLSCIKFCKSSMSRKEINHSKERKRKRQEY